MITALDRDVMSLWKPVKDEVMDLSEPGSARTPPDVEDGTTDPAGIFWTESPRQQRRQVHIEEGRCVALHLCCRPAQMGFHVGAPVGADHPAEKLVERRLRAE